MRAAYIPHHSALRTVRAFAKGRLLRRARLPLSARRGLPPAAPRRAAPLCRASGAVRDGRCPAFLPPCRPQRDGGVHALPLRWRSLAARAVGAPRGRREAGEGLPARRAALPAARLQVRNGRQPQARARPDASTPRRRWRGAQGLRAAAMRPGGRIGRVCSHEVWGSPSGGEGGALRGGGTGGSPFRSVRKQPVLSAVLRGGCASLADWLP